MSKKKLFIAVLLVCATFARAETAHFSVGVSADGVTISATLRYAGDTPYVSLGDLLRDLGGAVRVLPEQLQANHVGKTVILGDGDVAVSAPGLSYSLIHPARAQDEDIYISLVDTPGFFSRAYQIQVEQVEAPLPPPSLTPITPEESLLEEPEELMLEGLAPLSAPAADMESGEEELTDALLGELLTEETEADPEDEPGAVSVDDAGPFSLIVTSIVLDPGHGGQDSGAAVGDDVVEKDISLGIALHLRHLLKEMTLSAIHLTRDGDVDMSPNMRAKAANAAGGDLLISIHVGYAGTPFAEGTTIFSDQLPLLSDGRATQELREQFAARRTYGEQAAPLAHHIAQNLAAGKDTLGPVTVRMAPLILQRFAEMPCVLIETAYLSNPEQVALFSDEAYLEKAAQSLAFAIISALRENAH